MSRKPIFHLNAIPGFLAASAVGIVVVVVVCLSAPIDVQIACIGILVVLVLSLAIVRELRPGLPEYLHLLNAPIALARDPEIYELYGTVTGSLKETSLNNDRAYRELALERIRNVAHELAEIAEGRIIFTGTETWRTAYARLLRSPSVHHYRSVSHVTTSTYWQDEPGRQSMQVNFELVDEGTLNVERIAIVADQLWPAGERLPVEPLGHWIDEQYNHGISIRLVRQSTLANEPDLLLDMGLYSTRAVGFQELDEHGRTVRFTLSFDFAQILAAESRWERLSVYSTSYRELLDQSAPDPGKT
jgi:hypothetical protein